MASLTRRAFGGLAVSELIIGLLLLAPAGTLRYWQAWAYWLVFSACAAGITVYFLGRDPALIERRLAAGPTAEGRRGQKVIQAAASMLFCALLVIPAADHRLRLSVVPTWIALASDAVVAAGFAIVFLAFRENSHAAATVRVEQGQPLVATGPYGCVRHPMYAGAVLLLLATPPALGSWWGMAAAVALCGVIVARLLDEERLLAASLPGYEAYQRAVRYRLVPGVW